MRLSGVWGQTISRMDAVHDPPLARPDRWAHGLSHAFGLVLCLVLGTFALGSLVSYSGWTGVVLTAMSCASATTALASARARTVTVRRAAFLSVVAVLLAVFGAVFDSRVPFGLASIAAAALLAVSALAVLRAVLLADEVGFRSILGAVSVYVMLGLLFSFGYIATERIQHQPFFGTTPTQTGDFLFFSMTTLTNTGYGNLVPADQPGRMFSSLEMLIGQLFLVTLIAGLVSLWRPGQLLRSGSR